jgi:pimeloyl-ACP methyl ester carboxylesterase
LKVAETKLGRVAYERAGSGTPLLLLHANPGDHRDFAAVQPALAERFTTIGLDWPGYGESDAPVPASAATAMLYADVLSEFVDELGLGDIRLIGNSVGGYAAASLAIARPDQVAALVLVNSGGFTAHTPFTRLFCRLMGREAINRRASGPLARAYLRRRTETVREMRKRARGTEPTRTAVQAGVWRSFTHADHDLRDRASAITAPTLIIWGRWDPILPLILDGRQARKAIPEARFVRARTGHAAFAEQPDIFLGEAGPFLEDPAGYRDRPDVSRLQQPMTDEHTEQTW